MTEKWRFGLKRLVLGSKKRGFGGPESGIPGLQKCLLGLESGVFVVVESGDFAILEFLVKKGRFARTEIGHFFDFRTKPRIF